MSFRKNIMIFCGAGASYAISPSDYPTTKKFFELLPDKLKGKKYFKFIESYLNQGSIGRVIDIEEILWGLGELISHYRAITDAKNIVGWGYGNGQLLSTMRKTNTQSLGNMLDLVPGALQELKELESSINTLVYHLYGIEPKQEDLRNNWIALLGALKNKDTKMDFVTTNYDLILETVITSNKEDIHTDLGITGNVVRRLDLSLWSNPPSADNPGLLTKLHGSVHWRRNSSCIEVGGTGFGGDHINQVIIYPGYKGRPTAGSEFAIFHNYFRQALQQSSAVIFIGFAFRDEYINEICRTSISRTLPVVVINPDDSFEIPFHSDYYTYIKRGFDLKSVELASTYILELINK